MYKAQHRTDGLWFANGPGTEMDFYTHIFPAHRNHFSDKATAEAVASLMSDAFQQGVRHAQQEIQKSLGLV